MTDDAHRPLRPDLDPHDLDVRSIVGFAIGLSVLVAVAAGLMWFASVFLRNLEEAQDPAPPVLLEAREAPEIPGPLLQEYPLKEMRELRAAEEKVLTSYAWVDEAAGVASIPIERAIELMAEAAQEADPQEGSGE